MKRGHLSFPVLRFAAAVFVAASTSVQAGTAATGGRVEVPNNKTRGTNTSTPEDAVLASSLIPKNVSSTVHNDSSPPTLVDQSSRPRDHRTEVGQSADVESEESGESEDDDLWESESGIVYGGFGWKHDKRGGEGGGGGGSRGGGSYGGPGGIVVLPPPFLYGGHYPKTSSGASRPRPFGFLRG
ncbi:hypothetical protein PG993_001618 [Apiospora rasikravindrae]|uniref:Uncharacterized protein n=1 Tax=Apiospora rasikravindrae TaxID=990691 RepID=A0ABR1UE22_9PEZI